MANNNNNKLTPADSWCRTKACEEVKYTFKWVIDKFRDRPEENDQVLIIGINVEFSFYSLLLFAVDGVQHVHHSWSR